ncbi:MAG: patatin-like phospholipase family protein [Burkholderiales bacterium]|nr:patatin-like phospholipase family protein [Burkholderiales bacterium]
MRKKVVTLALQGGGSHGAFTWGVLDRLLEDDRIEIEGISGASAGAMNAAVLAYGLTTGGREGARQALKDFWESVASKAPFNFMPEDWFTPVAIKSQTALTPAFKTFLFLARFFSPYQLNPFNLNPLRDILARQLDFERLRADCRIELFIAATQVSTGMLKLFRTKQLTIDVLLASACVPSLHHTIEIDGEAYWDGGLTANPPIRPLLYKCSARDILVILLHPCRRPVIPTNADDIWHRLTEISFSSTLFTELQGLALAKQEAELGLFSVGRLERRLRHLNMHLIDSQELMSQLSTLSKLNTQSAFINALRDEGRSRTDEWLEKNFQLIGVRSSFTLAGHLY